MNAILRTVYFLDINDQYSPRCQQGVLDLDFLAIAIRNDEIGESDSN